MAAEPILGRIITLLSHREPEVQCAAAKVLGVLKVKTQAVVKALGDAAHGDNVLLREYAIDALAAIGGTAVVPALINGLGSSPQGRARAVAALHAFGASAIPILLKRYPKAPIEVRRGIVETLAQSGESSAPDALLDILACCDLAMAKHLCSCLGEILPTLQAADRLSWWKRLDRFFRSPAAKKEVAAVAGLRLIRYLGHPESAKLLTEFIGPRRPAIVRRHALQAFRAMETLPSLTSGMSRRLLEVATDWSETESAQVATEILRRLPADPSLAPDLQKLLNDPHPSVQSMAMVKLAELPSESAAMALLSTVGDADPVVSRRAVDALSRNPAARPAILKEFVACSDPARLDALAVILRRFEEPLPAPWAKKLQAKLTKALDKLAGAAPVMFSVLARSSPETAAKTVLAKAQALKRARKYAQAESALSIVERTGVASADLRLQLALLRVKTADKELAKPQRERSVALQAIAELLRAGEPVLKAVRADRALQKEDLYYLGFHFSERLGVEREFGGELLKLVSRKSPRSAVGKNAKNKLKLEGMG